MSYYSWPYPAPLKFPSILTHSPGNETYSHWASKAWDWLAAQNLITNDQVNPPAWRILDGTYITDNCTTLTPIQWSYNVGLLLNAAAVMWNATGHPMWEERAMGIWGAAIVRILP